MRIPVAGWVAPFGDPGITDRSHLPRAFRSVPRPSSPLSAKASTRCPSLALDPAFRTRSTPPRTGAKPAPAQQGRGPRETCPCQSRARGPMHAQRPHMKTLLRTRRSACAAPGRVRLGHMTNSLFTLQSTPAQRRGSADPQRLSLALLRNATGCANCVPMAAVVEVNGIEPMTSCLQSRRSPN